MTANTNTNTKTEPKAKAKKLSKPKVPFEMSSLSLKVHDTDKLPNPLRPYEYMPASLDSMVKRFCIGVKYGINTTTSIKKIKGSIRIIEKDRTVWLTRSYVPTTSRIAALDLDEVQETDCFSDKTLLGRMGYNFGMVNAHAISDKYVYADYDLEKQGEVWPEIVADSGGFQLSGGKVDFLDPKKIIDTHNKSCSLGMALDIPVFLDYHEHYLLKMGKLQKRNSETFLKLKRPSLDLINVCHGSSFYLREAYMDIVDEPKMNRLALGGTKSLDPLEMALHLLFTIGIRPGYEQYHVLGVSGLERWVLLCYIANKGLTKLITSDSSSYLQIGTSLGFYDPWRLGGILRISNKGSPQRKAIELMGHDMFLPCSCPVCHLAKYPSVVVDQANPLGFAVLVAHNLNMVYSYVEQILDLTKNDRRTIISSLSHIMSPHKLRELNTTLTAIDMALDSSVTEAAKRFAPSLLDKFPRKGAKGLFKSVRSKANTDNPAVHARYKHILTSYKEYYETGKVPKAKVVAK